MVKYEDINLSELPFHLIERQRGIYFLYRGQELVYIGQTTNLISRIVQHLLDKRKEFDSYKFMKIEGNIDLSKIEIFLIQKYKPVYNISYNELGKRKKRTITRNNIKPIGKNNNFVFNLNILE